MGDTGICTEWSCGTGLGEVVLPGDPSNNVVLSAVGVKGGIQVSWTFPSTNPYGIAFVKVFRGLNSNLNNAVLQANVSASFYLDVIAEEEIREYFYWIQLVSVNGTALEFVGPVSAIPLSNLEGIIEYLTGKIDAGVLATSLRSEIDRITTLTNAITEESTLRVTAEEAFANTVSLLNTSLDGVAAAVLSEQTARVTANEAIANSINQTEVALGDQVAAVQEAMTARMDITDGKVQAIGALYTVKVGVNGLIGGFGVYNDGTQVEAGFDVDTFWIGRTNADKRKPFIISNDIVYIDESCINQLTFTKLKDVSGNFVVENGLLKASYIDTRGLTIKDANGNVILASGTPLDWSNITNQPAGIYNSNVTITGLGYTGALDATKNVVTRATTAPTSPANGDIWVDTSVTPNVTKVRVANAWQIASNLTTDTNQLTDSANLGGTAAWGSITSIPYETIYTNDDSVSLGFNPTFSKWTTTYPYNWVTYAGSAPTKETTIKKIGEFAVRYVAAGSNIGMYCAASFPTNPLPLGTFLSGTTDIYLVSRTSGLPGIMVRLYTNSGLTTYVDTLAQPGGTTTAVWYRVPWTARVGAAQQIYGIRIFILGSYSAFTSGAFTGTVIFDNLQFALFDASVDNKAITIASDGSLTGGGGGQVTLSGLGAGTLATKSSVNWATDLINIPAFGNFAYLSSITSANISTYIQGAAIGRAYIADAAISSAKIGNLEVGTINIANNAVSIPISGSGSGTGASTVSTVSSDFSSGKTCITIYTYLNSTSGPSATVILKRKGVQIKSWTINLPLYDPDYGIYAGSATFVHIDEPGAGSVYYSVTVEINGTFSTDFFVLGLKK